MLNKYLLTDLGDSIFEETQYTTEKDTANETIDWDLRTVPREQQNFKGCMDIRVS